MQAAVITPFGQPWVPQERPIAAPGAGQILVKTQACGVYRTDLHAPCGSSSPRRRWCQGNKGVGIAVAVLSLWAL